MVGQARIAPDPVLTAALWQADPPGAAACVHVCVCECACVHVVRAQEMDRICGQHHEDEFKC